MLPKRLLVRNLTLYELLQAFTTDAGMRLDRAASEGAEVPFEVVETDVGRGGGIPLYCYRPLTGHFIRERLGLLVALPTYGPAAGALEGVGGLELYLHAQGLVAGIQEPRALADLVLRHFLARVFKERSEFTFDTGRFDVAYEQLERALYEGRCVTEVIARLHGIDLDPGTSELALGEGMSIVRATALAAAPTEFSAGESSPLLLVLRVAHDRVQRPSTLFACGRFRLVLTALRLYEKGGYALGSVGYARIDDGAWSPVALGASGFSRRLTLIPRDSEDELRAFCNLIARRLPRTVAVRSPDSSGAGELSWALARFEMGCERLVAFEALTDHLLALRALLEPEGPSSGRLPQRLSMVCAAPKDRKQLAERTARAISLERAVIAGLASTNTELETLAEELAEHLRAILRDVICGHLDADVRGVADDLLAEAAAPEAAVTL